MILVENYGLAVFLCVVAMISWGSWQNTQNLIGMSWRFEHNYWDFFTGIMLFALLMAFTFGSLGNDGRSFIPDVKQAHASSLLSAAIGGVIWNTGTLLLVAAISVAGMSVGAASPAISYGLIVGNFCPERVQGSPKRNPPSSYNDVRKLPDWTPVNCVFKICIISIFGLIIN